MSYFDLSPPQSRIITFSGETNDSIVKKKDPDSTLFYWFDFSNITGEAIISSCTVTPESGLTASLLEINASEYIDTLGIKYKKGKLCAVTVSGGTDSTEYELKISVTLSSGEIDERTITISVENM